MNTPPKPRAGHSEISTDAAMEHASDLQRLHEGVRVRNQLFESIKLQLIGKIQESSVQRAISALESVVPSHKLESVAERAGIILSKGESDAETIIIAATDIAKRKLDLQNRLTSSTEEQEVKAITKLLQIARVAEQTLVDVAKTFGEGPASSDVIATKVVVMGFGDEAFKRIRPLLNERLITIPLHASSDAPVVDGQHRSFIQAVLAAEHALVGRQEEMKRLTHEHIDRIALFRKLAANMRRNAHAFRGNGVDLRINQLNALHALASFLENEGYGDRIGYYKQPTGAGKTFLFGIIMRLMDVKTLVLVPRTNLRDQTRDELIESVGIPDKNIQIFEPGAKVMGRPIAINTYQNHIWRMSNDPVYQQEVSRCELVICDEAHKSLGPATQDSIEALDGEFDDEMTEEDESSQQTVLEHINQYTSRGALKLGFTATPELSQKSVQDAYRIPISESSYSELVRARVIKKFKVRQVDANVRAGEIEGGKISIEKEVALLHRENIYKQLLQAFKQAKEEVDEELYALATCATIDECDAFSRIAEELGLRPMIVTNREYRKNPNINHQAKAERAILKGEKDIIVTVDKLKEGWNFRPLNAVILARATLSPANILQPAGRASRAYQQQKYAYIFEASWHPQQLQDASKGNGNQRNDKGVGGQKRRLSLFHRKPLTFAEALYLCGEEDVNSVCEGWEGEKMKYTKIYRLDHNGEVVIDGVIGVGVHRYATLHELNMGPLMDDIAEAGLQVLCQARTGKGIVDVYKKDEIEQLDYVKRAQNKIQANGEVMIGDVLGVSPQRYSMANGMSPPDLQSAIDAAGLPIIGLAHSGNHRVNVYEKEAVDQLPYVSSRQWEVKNNGDVWVCGILCVCIRHYAEYNELNRLSIERALKAAGLQPVGEVRGRRSQRVIKAYKKEEIEALPYVKRSLRKSSNEGEIEIEGVLCVTLSRFAEDHGGISIASLREAIYLAGIEEVGHINGVSNQRMKVYDKAQLEKLPYVKKKLEEQETK